MMLHAIKLLYIRLKMRIVGGKKKKEKKKEVSQDYIRIRRRSFIGAFIFNILFRIFFPLVDCFFLFFYINSINFIC